MGLLHIHSGTKANSKSEVSAPDDSHGNLGENQEVAPQVECSLFGAVRSDEDAKAEAKRATTQAYAEMKATS